MSEHDPEPSVLRSVALRLALFTGLASLALVAVLGGGFVGALLALVLALPRLDSSGALEREAFGPAVALAAAVVAAGLLAELGVRMLRRLLAPKPGPISAIVSIAVSPWIWLGLASVVAGSVLVRPGMPAVLAGASLLVSTAWPVGAVAILAALGTLRASRVLRNRGDRSAYLAGAITVAGLAIPVVLAAGLLGLVAGGSAVAKETAEPRCQGIVECTRQAVVQQQRGRSASVAARPAGLPDGGADELGLLGRSGSAWTRTCFEKLSDPGVLGAAREQARRLVATDVEDLVQETLLAVCAKNRSLLDPVPYFKRSLTYGAIDRRRTAARWRSCELEEVPLPTCARDPEAEYLVQEDREQLRGALCRLSPDHREVLELVYFKQLSELEAAAKLGISHSAARKRVERAREELQGKFPSACR